jgi:hypothetical protein
MCKLSDELDLVKQELLKAKEDISHLTSELSRSPGRAYLMMICDLDLRDMENELERTRAELAIMTTKYKKIRAKSLQLALSSPVTYTLGE